MPGWWSSIKLWLRQLHRDLGVLAVGLTFVYAISGIAVSGYGDWDPNYSASVREYELSGLPDVPIDASNADAMARLILETVEVPAPDAFNQPDGNASYSLNGTDLVVYVGAHEVVANLRSGYVRHIESAPRWLVRTMNWLHLNRGKPAWRVFAIGYAMLLMVLAISGLFLLPRGGKGLKGRAGVLLLLGIAMPIAYVELADDRPDAAVRVVPLRATTGLPDSSAANAGAEGSANAAGSTDAAPATNQAGSEAADNHSNEAQDR